MPKCSYLGRHAVFIANEQLRLTVTEEGGHIAELFHRKAAINPLWVPHWTTGEPSLFGPAQEEIFANGVESRLLFGILGHNLCIDLFGGPSETEAAAGLTSHGEASVLPYDIQEDGRTLTCSLHMPLAQLDFQRTLTLQDDHVQVHETVRNLAAWDRPLAWTQHVTLSPPFLDPATTEFRATGSRGAVIESGFDEAPYLLAGAEFYWPNAPLMVGSAFANLQRMKAQAPASSYTAIAMKPGVASWTAWSPEYRLAISYIWQASDFPWLGIWEENQSRPFKPWNKQGVTRGMEFGTSPFPESRRAMVERGTLLGIPAYRWLPAHATLTAQYTIKVHQCDAVPGTTNA